MKVISLKKPHSVSFASNPIVFAWQVTPFTNLEQNSDIKVTVRILVEMVLLSGTFQEVYVQKLYPDATGKISIDASSVINPYLKYYTPRLDLSNAVPCTGQTLRYRVETVPEGPYIDLPLYGPPDTYFAVKGGLAYEAWHYKEFFTRLVEYQKMPLLFAAKKERTDPEGKQFLFWLYPKNDFAEQTITYKIYFSDGTSAVKNNLKITSPQWSVNCVPSGFTQSGLQGFVPSGKSVVKYSIAITTGIEPLVPVVAEYFYTLDTRNFYDPVFIIYRNSIGGLETVKLNGQVDVAGEYNYQQALRAVSPSWYNPHLIAQIKDEASEENMNYTGDTGFMSKEQEMKLRDLLLSPQKYMVQNNRLMPITNTGKSVRFYNNKEGMYSAVLTWQLAFVNTNYTPFSLMPQTRTCPAVVLFDIDQQSKYVLNFLYALEDPYNLLEVQVIHAAATYTYTYKGNAGMISQAMPYLSGAVEELTIKARTICNKESFPVEYGPFKTLTFETYGKANPIAVDDYYQVPVGFYGVLPVSALANDYDPDGEPIEALANWTIFDDAGNASPATFAIDKFGSITINTPIGFFGQHIIPYQIHNIGSATYVSGNVHLNFGTGPLQVYVKWVFRNVVSNPDVTTGEAWIDYYSDAACTVPYDITGLGLTIKGQIFGNGTPGDSYTFAGAGTKKLVISNAVIDHPGPPLFMHFEFKILANPGYIPVNP